MMSKALASKLPSRPTGQTSQDEFGRVRLRGCTATNHRCFGELKWDWKTSRKSAQQAGLATSERSGKSASTEAGMTETTIAKGDTVIGITIAHTGTEMMRTRARDDVGISATGTATMRAVRSDMADLDIASVAAARADRRNGKPQMAVMPKMR